MWVMFVVDANWCNSHRKLVLFEKPRKISLVSKLLKCLFISVITPWNSIRDICIITAAVLNHAVILSDPKIATILAGTCLNGADRIVRLHVIYNFIKSVSFQQFISIIFLLSVEHHLVHSRNNLFSLHKWYPLTLCWIEIIAHHYITHALSGVQK